MNNIKHKILNYLIAICYFTFAIVIGYNDTLDLGSDLGTIDNKIVLGNVVNETVTKDISSNIIEGYIPIINLENSYDTIMNVATSQALVLSSSTNYSSNLPTGLYDNGELIYTIEELLENNYIKEDTHMDDVWIMISNSMSEMLHGTLIIPDKYTHILINDSDYLEHIIVLSNMVEVCCITGCDSLKDISINRICVGGLSNPFIMFKNNSILNTINILYNVQEDGIVYQTDMYNIMFGYGDNKVSYEVSTDRIVYSSSDTFEVQSK